jgi:hypothetical protein
MRKLILLATLALAGCDADPYWDERQPMTNQQIAEAHEFCHSKNMLFWQYSNSRHETVKVECYIPNRSDQSTLFPKTPTQLGPNRSGL